jgi:hypothetical protein
MLTVKRMSPRTKQWHEMDIDITLEQYNRWTGGELIQNVMPNLTPDQREFLMTGYTKEDWAAMFPKDEE